MAHSAWFRKSPFSNRQFWKSAWTEPPLGWEKWCVQEKFAILAKEDILLDVLLRPKSEKGALQAGPHYE